MEGDKIYFGRRANEEREAALRSSDPNARRSHLEMARRYQQQADVGISVIPQEATRIKR